MQFYRDKSVDCIIGKIQRRVNFSLFQQGRKKDNQGPKSYTYTSFRSRNLLHLLDEEAGTKCAVNFLAGELLMGWQKRTLLVTADR